MENQIICIVCVKPCVTANNHVKCTACSRSMHKSCSISNSRGNFENKRFDRSCLLCDSQMIDTSHNKHFDFTKAEDVYASENCDANSNNIAAQ